MATKTYQTESPIEQRLLEHLLPRLSTGAKLRTQVPVKAHGNRFRLDFVLTDSNGHRLAIECDGRDFHEFMQDKARDMMLLNENRVDAMIRLRGCDIHYLPDRCIDWVARYAGDAIEPAYARLHPEAALLLSQVLPGSPIKPIIRARYMCHLVLKLKPQIEASQTCTILGKTADCLAAGLEMKSPYWSNRRNPSNPTPISDSVEAFSRPH